MQVEEAIASAKTFFEKVFAEEQISQVRLGEVEYDETDQAWRYVERRAAAASRRSLDGAGRQVRPPAIEQDHEDDDSGSRLPSVKIGQTHGEA